MFREKPYANMQKMMEEDSLFKQYGMALVSYSPGRSKVSMVVRKDMLNAYAAAHGAVIYALADVAFAVACNAGGQKAVGLSVNIHYRRPACEGDLLTAEACEESVGKTTGVYRIKIINGSGKLVAVADGLAYISPK